MDRTTNQSLAAYASLAEMLSLVQPLADLGPMHARVVSPAELPHRPRLLLDHQEHMTLRLRETIGVAIALDVLAERIDDGAYVREILLRRVDTRSPVEFGAVRVREDRLPPSMVTEIRSKQRPLGDILMSHAILKQIEPRWFFEFNAASRPASLLGCGRAFGRLGVIHCDGHAAIEVLEAVPDSV